MATYYFAVAFEEDTTTDPQPDGVHYDAQYGFAVDSGNGVQVLGPGSGASGEHFETVHIPGGTGTPNQFAVTVFSNLIGIDTSVPADARRAGERLRHELRAARQRDLQYTVGVRRHQPGVGPARHISSFRADHRDLDRRQ